MYDLICVWYLIVCVIIDKLRFNLDYFILFCIVDFLLAFWNYVFD